MLMFSGKLFTIIGAVLAVAVNGSPVDANGPPTKVADNKPQDAMGNVTFCADSGSGGACKQVPVHTDICNNVPTGFDKNISAFHPGQGINCTLFENIGCGGNSIPLKYPGSDHLDEVKFDKITSSFKCAHP